MKFLTNFDHSSIWVIFNNFNRTPMKFNQINLWKKKIHKE
jgi:hypothetical protein